MLNVTYKSEFKQLFFEYVATLKHNDQISDEALLRTCQEKGWFLKIGAIQSCIRELEAKIGKKFKIRLERIRGRNKGYQVISGLAQVEAVVTSTAKRARNAFKRGSKRMEGVDMDLIPLQYRETAVSKKNSMNALAAITSGILEPKKITRKETRIIDYASNELKALEALRNAGADEKE